MDDKHSLDDWTAQAAKDAARTAAHQGESVILMADEGRALARSSSGRMVRGRSLGLVGAMTALAALDGAGAYEYRLPGTVRRRAFEPTEPREKTPADLERIAAAEAKRARKAARKNHEATKAPNTEVRDARSAFSGPAG